ncbi:MAG TPA: hypothetical protein VGF55_27685 [Gemmataceae bacterium]|jgi:hypothetical protein
MSATLDVCPRCRTDVSRLVGLITTPTLACPKCRAAVPVSGRAVVNNWQFNIGVLAGVFVWTTLAVAVFISPEFAANAAIHLKRPAATIQDRVILALYVGVPAGLAAVPFGLLGRVIGCRVAGRLASRRGADLLGASLPRPATDSPAKGQHRVRHRLFADVAPALTGGPAPSPAAPPRRGIRVVAVAAWAGVFVGIGTLALAAVVVGGVGNGPGPWQPAAAEAARTWGPAMVFASIAAAAVLGGTGLLPGTRRKAA